jgi:hypothetical protein
MFVLCIVLLLSKLPQLYFNNSIVKYNLVTSTARATEGQHYLVAFERNCGAEKRKGLPEKSRCWASEETMHECFQFGEYICVKCAYHIARERRGHLFDNIGKLINMHV